MSEFNNTIIIFIITTWRAGVLGVRSNTTSKLESLQHDGLLAMSITTAIIDAAIKSWINAFTLAVVIE